MKRYTLSSKELCEKKRALRSLKRAQTEALTEEYIRESDGATSKKLLSLREFQRAGTVFLYYSVGREVSTVKLIEGLLEEKRRIALPVSGDGGVMEFYLIDSLSDLREGRYGIPEPPAGQAVRPGRGDIIIVPALCCDRRLHRLGHGAGYYDRYLAGTEAFSVCLCRRALLEDELPAGEHDAAVSLVLTD